MIVDVVIVAVIKAVIHGASSVLNVTRGVSALSLFSIVSER